MLEDQNFQAEQQDNRVGSAKRDIFLLAAGAALKYSAKHPLDEETAAEI